MHKLLKLSERLIANTSHDFKRYLFDLIQWDNRLIGIKGARGTGKITILLQWIIEQKLPTEKAAYFSLDDLYFTTHSLKDIVTTFYKNGSIDLGIDGVHKYKHWSQEIKNLYDFFPDLKIIFTGFSIIDIAKQEGDLSRRALMYELTGLSFREYLAMLKIVQLPIIHLEDLLSNVSEIKKSIPLNFRPFEHFSNYLQFGFYPFGLIDTSTA